ncbi:MAG: peroxiredoxin [Gammaproteobacteria bacterium]|nr:peroxiredoxin [Gammaproteobacteria bacterium]
MRAFRKTFLYTLIASALLSAGALAGGIEVGQQAPEFKLQDQNLEWQSLSDYRGQWVVLYFYPKDDTPGCTTEACNFRDEIFRFKALGAAVLGVSMDDVESHQAFAEKYSLPFPLLADTEGKVAKAYDAVDSYIVFETANRETFIINPQGEIFHHYEDVDPDVHAEEVLELLKANAATATEAG